MGQPTSKLNPFLAGLAICVIAGFVGTVASGMVWAFMEAAGYDASIPKGLTAMFAVPLAAGWFFIQLIDTSKL